MIQRISPGASDIRIFSEVPDRIEERPQCDSGDAGHFVPGPVDDIPNRKFAAEKVPKLERLQELSRLQTELEQARNLRGGIFGPRVWRRKSLGYFAQTSFEAGGDSPALCRSARNPGPPKAENPQGLRHLPKKWGIVDAPNVFGNQIDDRGRV